MQMLIGEYRRSLKMPEAEEYLDLLFYRPVAFLFVKAIYRLPITPNAVTMLSLGAGLISSWQFSLPALASAAVWYAAANVLDCSDGQLARLQNSGTPLGRIVDGIADYISSIAIFLGIGFGLARNHPEYWWLVFAAAISSALHALFFDYYQSEYISTVRGERNFLDREIERFDSSLHDKESKRRGKLATFFIRLYVRYLSLQRTSDAQRQTPRVDGETYRAANISMIRWWSLLGPTTNRSLLIGCALLGRPDLFLWITATIGNVWLSVCLIRQRKIRRSLAHRIAAEISSAQTHTK